MATPLQHLTAVMRFRKRRLTNGERVSEATTGAVQDQADALDIAYGSVSDKLGPRHLDVLDLLKAGDERKARRLLGDSSRQRRPEVRLSAMKVQVTMPDGTRFTGELRPV
jgi:hypothetical protein